jgi:hypothetical protein
MASRKLDSKRLSNDYLADFPKTDMDFHQSHENGCQQLQPYSSIIFTILEACHGTREKERKRMTVKKDKHFDQTDQPKSKLCK